MKTVVCCPSWTQRCLLCPLEQTVVMRLCYEGEAVVMMICIGWPNCIYSTMLLSLGRTHVKAWLIADTLQHFIRALYSDCLLSLRVWKVIQLILRVWIIANVCIVCVRTLMTRVSHPFYLCLIVWIALIPLAKKKITTTLNASPLISKLILEMVYLKKMINMSLHR